MSEFTAQQRRILMWLTIATIANSVGLAFVAFGLIRLASR